VYLSCSSLMLLLNLPPTTMAESAAPSPYTVLQLCDLPLPHIFDYLTLTDVLHVRLASREWRRRTEENLDPNHYAFWLRERLERDNLYLVKDTRQWTKASQTSLQYLVNFLTSQRTSMLEILGLTLRVASVLRAKGSSSGLFSSPWKALHTTAMARRNKYFLSFFLRRMQSI